MSDLYNEDDKKEKAQKDFREVTDYREVTDSREMSDFREVIAEENAGDHTKDNTGDNAGDEGTDKTVDSKKDASTTAGAGKSDNSEYEDVCFICRRPESKTGKMFKLPNNICVCNDCMHKTMETVSQFDYQGMLNNPNFQNDLDQFSRQNGFPNISFVNLADLQGDGGIPNKQKLKKKKKKEGEEPVLDIRNIPAPHKIKASLDRSEERRVGKEWRARGSPDH